MYRTVGRLNTIQAFMIFFSRSASQMEARHLLFVGERIGEREAGIPALEDFAEPGV